MCIIIFKYKIDNEIGTRNDTAEAQQMSYNKGMKISDRWQHNICQQQRKYGT